MVADEHADPELGCGAVKITPGTTSTTSTSASAPGIAPGDMLNMFDVEAKVVQTADGLVPDEFLGLDRFDARILVVERMKERGFLVPHIDAKDGEATEHDAEPRTIATPRRCDSAQFENRGCSPSLSGRGKPPRSAAIMSRTTASSSSRRQSVGGLPPRLDIERR